MSFTPRPPPDSHSSSLLPVGYEEWKKSSVSPILLTTLAELARIAARGVSTEALLAELVQLTMLATTVDGAGTMSCIDTTVTFVHADSPRTMTVDQLQERLQQGPCRTSVQTQQPVAVRDFAESTSRRQWPDLAPAALKVGLHSTLAVPLLARGQAWGVLDIYRDQPHRWTFADLLICKTLADVVVSLLVIATDLEGARTATQPRTPLSTPDADTPQNEPGATDHGNSNGSTVRADSLRATLNARLKRLNTRLSATRNQLSKQTPPTEQ
jgi:GAF domain-containing protein